ncbi:MAG: hypothetical protein AAF125_26355, partial [Chloroflexota bacterium]
HALGVSESGRGDAMRNYLQRNIFFGDDAQLNPLSGAQFVLHGPKSDDVIGSIGVDTADIPALHGQSIEIEGHTAFVARRKPHGNLHWTVITEDESAAATIWDVLHTAGATLAGAIAFNTLRIQAGVPAFGREITADYLPLEVGLWDEISFAKGCYTGQEIIARMESRSQLSRLMVRVSMREAVPTPTDLFDLDGKAIGKLTSSVADGSGAHVGIAIVKQLFAGTGTTINTETGQPITVRDIAGARPPEHMLKEI